MPRGECRDPAGPSGAVDQVVMVSHGFDREYAGAIVEATVQMSPFPARAAPREPRRAGEPRQPTSWEVESRGGRGNAHSIRLVTSYFFSSLACHHGRCDRACTAKKDGADQAQDERRHDGEHPAHDRRVPPGELPQLVRPLDGGRASIGSWGVESAFEMSAANALDGGVPACSVLFRRFGDDGLDVAPARDVDRAEPRRLVLPDDPYRPRARLIFESYGSLSSH